MNRQSTFLSFIFIKKIIFWIIFLPFFLLFIQTANAASACVVPPSGMVGWWTGDQNANDIMGTNYGY